MWSSSSPTSNGCSGGGDRRTADELFCHPGFRFASSGNPDPFLPPDLEPAGIIGVCSLILFPRGAFMVRFSKVIQTLDDVLLHGFQDISRPTIRS
jgi:hypothetical protein